MLTHLVVVDRLLEQLSLSDEGVNRGGRGVGGPEERLALDLADELAVDLDDRVGPDHLQVEHEAAGLDCLDHLTQDVHDVLRIDSSERPGENDEIERVWLELDLGAGG